MGQTLSEPVVEKVSLLQLEKFFFGKMLGVFSSCIIQLYKLLAHLYLWLTSATFRNHMMDKMIALPSVSLQCKVGG